MGRILLFCLLTHLLKPSLLATMKLLVCSKPHIFVFVLDLLQFFYFGYTEIFPSDRIRSMYKLFPRVPVPPHLVDVSDDEDVQNLQESLGEARSRVDYLTSFLRAAIK